MAAMPRETPKKPETVDPRETPEKPETVDKETQTDMQIDVSFCERFTKETQTMWCESPGCYVCATSTKYGVLCKACSEPFERREREKLWSRRVGIVH